MYKPNTAYSIWVPVALMKWGWEAVVESTDGGNSWNKTSGQHTPTDPSFNATTNFPEYDDTVLGIDPPYPNWEAD